MRCPEKKRPPVKERVHLLSVPHVHDPQSRYRVSTRASEVPSSLVVAKLPRFHAFHVRHPSSVFPSLSLSLPPLSLFLTLTPWHKGRALTPVTFNYFLLESSERCTQRPDTRANREVFTDIIRLLKRGLISCRILQSRLPLRGIKKLRQTVHGEAHTSFSHFSPWDKVGRYAAAGDMMYAKYRMNL